MATIKIDPIETESRAGNPVRITGLCPTTPDCIVGDITTPDMGFTHERWHLDGTARTGLEARSLNMATPALSALADLARLLGAKG